MWHLKTVSSIGSHECQQLENLSFSSLQICLSFVPPYVISLFNSFSILLRFFFDPTLMATSIEYCGGGRLARLLVIQQRMHLNVHLFRQNWTNFSEMSGHFRILRVRYQGRVAICKYVPSASTSQDLENWLRKTFDIDKETKFRLRGEDLIEFVLAPFDFENPEIYDLEIDGTANRGSVSPSYRSFHQLLLWQI